MTELQKTEFDILKTFTEICSELQLPYFLVCGSALGAAKYCGFIPWDDDVDVALLRPDYETFCEKAPPLLPEHLFLQNYRSEVPCPFIYSKLRNSNTTYIETLIKDYNINHGVYIDIIPLDGYPKKRWKQILLGIRKKHYVIKNNCGNKNRVRTFKGRIYAKLLRLHGYHKRTAKTKARHEAYISKYPAESSSVICNHGSPYGKVDYISTEYYGKGAEAVFEGMKVRVPENVDGYLTSLYGDWRTPPPPEKRTYRHPCEILDLEKPYTDYAKR